MSIITERLEALNTITLDRGAHDSFEDGHCAMEVVSWLAGLGFTDAPECASPVLRRYTIVLNDRWDDEQRQALIPFLPRMVGTANDGLDDARERVASRFLLEKLLEPWLRLAGMDAEADQIPATLGLSYDEQRRTVRSWSDKAWEIRSQKRAELRAKVRAHLEAQPKPVAAAVAVAAAAAAAVAVAVADAAAAADAAAVAVAAADAVAAAVAVADAAADAAAAADADAVAAADAAAAAAADADADTWGTSYTAAYKAAKNYYSEHPETLAHITDLATKQRPLALELLDAMIAPETEEPTK